MSKNFNYPEFINEVLKSTELDWKEKKALLAVVSTMDASGFCDFTYAVINKIVHGNSQHNVASLVLILLKLVDKGYLKISDTEWTYENDHPNKNLKEMGGNFIYMPGNKLDKFYTENTALVSGQFHYRVFMEHNFTEGLLERKIEIRIDVVINLSEEKLRKYDISFGCMYGNRCNIHGVWPFFLQGGVLHFSGLAESEETVKTNILSEKIKLGSSIYRHPTNKEREFLTRQNLVDIRTITYKIVNLQILQQN